MNRAIEAIAVAVSISATLRPTPPSAKDAEKPWGDTHSGETGDLVARRLEGMATSSAMRLLVSKSSVRRVVLDDDAGRLKIAEEGTRRQRRCGIDAGFAGSSRCSVRAENRRRATAGGTLRCQRRDTHLLDGLGADATHVSYCDGPCKRERGSSVLAFEQKLKWKPKIPPPFLTTSLWICYRLNSNMRIDS